MPTPVREEDVIQAVRWKLGLPYQGDPTRHQEIIGLVFNDTNDTERVNRVARFLSVVFEDAVRLRLLLPRIRYTDGSDMDFLQTLWKVFVDWVKLDEPRRLPWVARLLGDAVKEKKGGSNPVASRRTNPPPTNLPPTTPAPPQKTTTPARQPDPRPSAPAAVAPTQPRKADSPSRPTSAPPASPQTQAQGPPQAEPPAPGTAGAPPADSPNPTGVDMTQGTDQNRPKPTGPAWQWKPIPQAEPDLHPESECKTLQSPEGWPVYAARVRGKKHKHEGTNGDDWFEVAVSGKWTLIAVSDGAGSKRFSRVGARASCQKAIEYLTQHLASVQIRAGLTAAALEEKAADTLVYAEDSVEQVQKCLHNAMHAGYAALEEEVKLRQGSQAHKRQLLNNREVAVEDLSATLLLAAHTTVQLEGRECSLVAACQIGDGVTATIDKGGHIALMCEPDSGDYSGETDFLTSRKKLDFPLLRQRTYVRVQPLRALFVMTDGVADDYFPADPGMARLYADLALNGILQIEGPSAEEAQAELSEHTPPNFDPASGQLDVADAMLVTQEKTEQFRLRSSSVYASELGKPVELVARSPAILRAGLVGSPLLERAATPVERLRLWIDSYHVRGSFDDRTLVVLHRERS